MLHKSHRLTVLFLVAFAFMITSPKPVIAGNVDGTEDGFDKGWSEDVSNFGEIVTCTVRFYDNTSTNRIGSFDHPESNSSTRSPMMWGLTSSFPVGFNDDGDTCTYVLFNKTGNNKLTDVPFTFTHDGSQGTSVTQNVTVGIGNFSFTGVFVVNVRAFVTATGNRVNSANSNATLGVAPYIKTAVTDNAKINFFKRQRVALTLGQTGADGVMRFRNITWNITENNVYLNDFGNSRLSNISTSTTDVTLVMANFTSTATETNDKRFNFTAWGGNNSGGGALHFRFTGGSANSTVFNLTRQLTCSALNTDFTVYNRGETPVTSGTIQDVNGGQWNTSVGDRFNYTLVNETTIQNTSIDFLVTNGSWAVNTRIPTYANASTSHKGFAYKLNFTDYTNTTPLSNYNFCTYVNAYNVSRGLFCDAHAQNTSTLAKDSLILDNRSTEDDNEQKTYNTDADTIYGWAHCVNARNESLASRIVSFTVLDTANNTAPGTSTDVRTTAADGWTTIGSPFNYSARSPAGTWFLWVNVSDNNGNEGGDNESLSFISTVSGINLIGRVFFWINGTVVGSASITANIMDGTRIIDTKTGTTDNNGGYSLSLGTTLVQDQVYTVNITAVKGSLRSYVIQRFRV